MPQRPPFRGPRQVVTSGHAEQARLSTDQTRGQIGRYQRTLGAWLPRSRVAAVHDGSPRAAVHDGSPGPRMAGIAAVCPGERLADDLRDQLLRGCEQRHALHIRMLVTSGDSRVSDPHRRTVSETSISVTQARTHLALQFCLAETGCSARSPQTIVCVTPAGSRTSGMLACGGVPLPSGERRSCVCPSLAAGIAGLTASASSVPARAPSGVLRGGSPLPRGQPGYGPARHAA